MRLVEVPPTGYLQGYPVYPATGGMRRFRDACRGRSHHEVAHRLGVSLADVLGLERGRLVPAEGWAPVFGALIGEIDG